MSMFGSWVIVTTLIIIIVAGALGLLPGLLLGGRSAEIRTTTGMGGWSVYGPHDATCRC